MTRIRPPWRKGRGKGEVLLTLGVPARVRTFPNHVFPPFLECTWENRADARGASRVPLSSPWGSSLGIPPVSAEGARAGRGSGYLTGEPGRYLAPATDGERVDVAGNGAKWARDRVSGPRGMQSRPMENMTKDHSPAAASAARAMRLTIRPLELLRVGSADDTFCSSPTDAVWRLPCRAGGTGSPLTLGAASPPPSIVLIISGLTTTSSVSLSPESTHRGVHRIKFGLQGAGQS